MRWNQYEKHYILTVEMGAAGDMLMASLYEICRIKRNF